MSVELLALRIIHVLGAIIWGGTSIFNAFLLGPAMALAGPAAGPMMGALRQKKMFTIIPTVAGITMLAGFRMMMLDSGGFSSIYFTQRSGITYTAGAVGAVIAFTIFMGMGHPAIMKVMALGQQIPQTPEAERGVLMAQMNAQRARAGFASKSSALVLVFTAMAMAIGRYV